MFSLQHQQLFGTFLKATKQGCLKQGCLKLALDTVKQLLIFLSRIIQLYGTIDELQTTSVI